MDLFSTLQLLHEAVMLVLVTTIYGRWRGTITEPMKYQALRPQFFSVGGWWWGEVGWVSVWW